MASQIDNTKAIALPLLIILALVIAALITRQTFARAMGAMKSDLRLFLLFTSGILCTLISFFILTSAAWAYAIGSALIGYAFCLACAPGMLAQFADKLLLVAGAWFGILIGIPNHISDGIISTTAQDACFAYFSTNSATMCEAGYLTFATIIAILIIVMNFFAMVALVSAVFEGESTSLTSTLPVTAHGFIPGTGKMEHAPGGYTAVVNTA